MNARFVFRTWVILTKIHRKLVYKKTRWLKNYIQFNIEKRKIAKRNKDDFGNVFFKLMNNAFYGKTLENVRNRQNIEIVYDRDRFQNLTRKPTNRTKETINYTLQILTAFS